MMWIPNIKCGINEGQAFLDQSLIKIKKCNGNCSRCNSFYGVNIRQVGEKYIDGCCADKIV
jgi:hypothetical protein